MSPFNCHCEMWCENQFMHQVIQANNNPAVCRTSFSSTSFLLPFSASLWSDFLKVPPKHFNPVEVWTLTRPLQHIAVYFLPFCCTSAAVFGSLSC
ncbi:hypothetical protein GOODEAATRI_027360 [Goodea atripinnis]|uniref:Uncharacterized protein n=1 Tax=Goodea atripinnis TaxID=208336 RepID=A0ABV0ML88_9TELE